MKENNFKKLAEEEEYNAPFELKRRVRNKVSSNLSLVKFVGDIFDLYIGKAGQVITEMLGSLEETENGTFADSDDKQLPPNASHHPSDDIHKT